MMLIEETTVPDAALPVAQFKAHLRLGTGFGEDTLQDDVLIGFLRAAIAAIEARTGKILIEREFRWTVYAWRDAAGQVLPVAPVTALSSVAMFDAVDSETFWSSSAFWLEQDAQYPRLRPAGSRLASIPRGGCAHISFVAGMAADWGGLPADLGQAVLMLAAHYYEHRQDTGLADGCMPFGVTSLIQRYRPMRINLGTVQ